jgi:hypothetical protein
MKRMFRAHCSDIVKLLSEMRICACGTSSGCYLECIVAPVQTFIDDQVRFSPPVAKRRCIYPAPEPFVRFILSGP